MYFYLQLYNCWYIWQTNLKFICDFTSKLNHLYHDNSSFFNSLLRKFITIIYVSDFIFTTMYTLIISYIINNEFWVVFVSSSSNSFDLFISTNYRYYNHDRHHYNKKHSQLISISVFLSLQHFTFWFFHIWFSNYNFCLYIHLRIASIFLFQPTIATVLNVLNIIILKKQR